jgi:hypothetical protein
MTQYQIDNAIFKSYSNGIFKLQICTEDAMNIEHLAIDMDYKGLGPLDLCFDDSGHFILNVNACFMTSEEVCYYFTETVSCTVYLFETPLASPCVDWLCGYVPRTLILIN